MQRVRSSVERLMKRISIAPGCGRQGLRKLSVVTAGGYLLQYESPVTCHTAEWTVTQNLNEELISHFKSTGLLFAGDKEGAIAITD